MATPTIIRSATITARGMSPDIHQVIAYHDGAVYQVYSVEAGGKTTLQTSRPWGTEQGAIADWERFTKQAREQL